MKETTKNTFKQDVIDTQGVVLVDVWAPWCGPCRGMEPVLDQIHIEAKDWAQIVKLDASKEMEMVQELGVTGLPTYIVYKNGKPLSSFIGAVPKADLLNEMVQAKNTA